MSRTANSTASFLRRRLLRPAGVFAGCDRALAAVEFALLLPLLLTLFLGTFEITRAIEINRKVNNAANTIADLVTQTDTSALEASLEDFMKAGKLMLSPYADANLGIVVSAIYLDNDDNAKVRWSIECNSTILTKNAPPPTSYNDLATLYDKDVDLVVAVSSYHHEGVFGSLLHFSDLMFDFVEMAPYRPRTTDQIDFNPSTTDFCP